MLSAESSADTCCRLSSFPTSTAGTEPLCDHAACQALTPALSSRILQEAQAQQAEVDAEADELAGGVAASAGRQVAEPARLAHAGGRALQSCLSRCRAAEGTWVYPSTCPGSKL